MGIIIVAKSPPTKCSLKTGLLLTNYKYIEIGSFYGAQAGIELTILLLQPPEFWDYRGLLPYLALRAFSVICLLFHFLFLNLFFSFLVVLDFELRALQTSSPFSSSYFGDWGGVSLTICPSLSRAMTLMISASRVARMTSVSHQCLTPFSFS
jgi:hypothetical protein